MTSKLITPVLYMTVCSSLILTQANALHARNRTGNCKNCHIGCYEGRLTEESTLLSQHHCALMDSILYGIRVTGMKFGRYKQSN
jgi:hypothetical protein